MPRTPAPLTVEPATAWVVSNSSGISCAWFAYEADARAFVALPALIEALQAFIDLLDGQPEPLPPLAWIPELEKARAALAQADGPAPTEEK